MPGKILIWIIRGYQKFLSPLCPGVCRFRPTCSEYMIQAIKIHGVFYGVYLGCKRLLRCHPWGGCGEDPVPPAKEKKK